MTNNTTTRGTDYSQPSWRIDCLWPLSGARDYTVMAYCQRPTVEAAERYAQKYLGESARVVSITEVR